jgi:hypothetical protein
MFEDLLTPFQAAFSHGEVSPFLFGRVDLQAYSSALRTSKDGFVRTEGSWSNRPGTQYCAAAATNTDDGSVLIPFTFNVGQTYVIEFSAGNIQLFSQGALINTGTNPYSQSALAGLRYAQSADTLTIVHPSYPPYEFKRTGAGTFTFLPASYINGPFLQQNPDGVTFIYASAQSGTVTLTATAHIFNANQVGGEVKLTQQDLSQITPWEAVKELGSSGIAPLLGTLCRSNGNNYKLVGLPAVATGAITIATGTYAPSWQQGTQSDGTGNAIPSGPNASGVNWQYTDSGYGTVLITAFISSTQVTGVVQPNYVGGPGILPISVVGGPQGAGVGPWNFTGDGTTKLFSMGTSTATDPNKFIVTVAGVYQQPSLYSISTTSILFLSAPANGAAINVQQITALGQTTYWAFDAFSADQGYPGAVTYFPDRLVLAGTPKQPVGVFGSKTSAYHDFGFSSPIVNSDGFAVFLNARQLNAISDLVPLQDIIIGTSNIIWRLWPGQGGQALGPLSIAGVPQAFYGDSPQAAAVLYGDSMIYAIYGGRRIHDLVYQFQFDKYIGGELTAYSRHLVPFGVQIIKMQYAPDPWSLLFALRSDGVLLCCTYVREQQMIAWSQWHISNDVDDIALIPENNSYSLYMITNRTINGSNVRYVERLSQWETSTIYDYKFMDCSLTYDGRNTSATTMRLTGGTTWVAGDVGTLTASGTSGWANFASTDPGYNNVIQLFDSAGTLSRVLITAYISPTQVSVRFMDPIAADLQNTSVLTWTFARTYFTGAAQLSNQLVTALVDSNAYCGTNGTPILQISLTGTFTLPMAGGVVCVGLQYDSDLETLSLNQQGLITLRERAKGMPMLYLDVTGTRGLITGTDFTNMYPIKERAYENYTAPTNNQEGILVNVLDSDFGSECHVCVRQPYPLPCTIRMIIPSVNVGEPVG